MSSISYSGSALASALRGITQAGGTIRGAAGDVVKASLKQVTGPSSDVDTMTISDGAKDASLEEGLEGVGRASYAHLASQAVVQTDDEQFQVSLDLAMGLTPR